MMPPSRSFTVACLLFAVPALTGCFQTHLRRDAPGLVDVRKPPEKIEERAVEEPGDPGERWLTLHYGVLAGGGVDGRERGADSSGWVLSLDVALHYTDLGYSHDEDGWLYLWFPPTIGLHLGYRAIEAEPVDLAVLRPFYLEASWSLFSLGWQADFERPAHGPQFTLSFGPLYLRTGYLFDHGGQFEAGLVLQGFHAWIWSR